MIYSQKTLNGKTAGGYLKNAEVSETQSGDFYVTSPDLPGCILILTDYDNMTICDYSGIVAKLELSNRAYEKLSRLTKAANDAYFA